MALEDQPADPLDALLDTGLERLYRPMPSRTDGARLGLSARYELGEELASGGVGRVYTARDLDLDREVAVKVLRSEHVGKGGLIARLWDEARLGGCLEHPGILPIYDFGFMEPGQPFLVARRIHGRTWSEVFAEASPPATAEIERFLQVCRAVAFAHEKRIIHRDLKPSNIMVGPLGEVVVMDWGLARFLDSERPEPEIESVAPRRVGESSVSGTVLGTPGYMSPEQARGEEAALAPTTDVFSLGSILCQIITGAPAFPTVDRERARRLTEAGDLREAWGRLDATPSDQELQELVRACLAPRPEQRPAHAGVIADRLARHLTEQEGRLQVAEARRLQAEARYSAERRARRLQLMLAVVIGLVSLGVVTAWLVDSERKQTERQGFEHRIEVGMQQARQALRRVPQADAAELAATDAPAAVLRGLLAAPHPDATVTGPAAELLADLVAAQQQRRTELTRAAAWRRQEEQLHGVAADPAVLTVGEARVYTNPRRAAVYAEAFAPLLQSLDGPDAEIRLRGLGDPVLLAAWLTDWGRALPPGSRRDRALHLANRLDPDPWRRELRSVLQDDPGLVPLPRLRTLLASTDLGLQPAVIAGLCIEAGVLRQLWWQAMASGERRPARLAAGEYRDAEGVIESALRRHGHELPLQLAAVDLHLLARDHAAARTVLDGIPPRHREHPAVAQARALLLAWSGRPEEVVVESRSPADRHLEALRSLSRGDEPAASPVLEGLIAESAGGTLARLRLAELRIRTGRLDDAATVLDPLEREGPARLQERALVRRVTTLYLQSRPGDAITALQARPRLLAGSTTLQAQLGFAQTMFGQIDPGLERLRLATTRADATEHPHILLIDALENLGRRNEALATARRGLQLFPERLSLAERLCRLAYMSGRAREVLTVGESFFARRQRSEAMLKWCGLAQQTLGDLDAAIRYHSAAIEGWGRDGQPFLARVHCLIGTGRVEAADEAHRQNVARTEGLPLNDFTRGQMNHLGSLVRRAQAVYDTWSRSDALPRETPGEDRLLLALRLAAAGDLDAVAAVLLADIARPAKDAMLGSGFAPQLCRICLLSGVERPSAEHRRRFRALALDASNRLLDLFDADEEFVEPLIFLRDSEVFAGVRGRALGNLEQEERAAWLALWQRVEERAKHLESKHHRDEIDEILALQAEGRQLDAVSRCIASQSLFYLRQSIAGLQANERITAAQRVEAAANPANHSLWEVAGDLYRHAGDLAGARRCYELMSRHGGFAHPCFVIAALDDPGRTGDGSRGWSASLARISAGEDEQPSMTIARARCLMAMGLPEPACELLVVADRGETGKYAPFLTLQASCALKAGRLDRAQETLVRLGKLEPQPSDLAQNLAAQLRARQLAAGVRDRGAEDRGLPDDGVQMLLARASQAHHAGELALAVELAAPLIARDSEEFRAGARFGVALWIAHALGEGQLSDARLALSSWSLAQMRDVLRHVEQAVARVETSVSPSLWSLDIGVLDRLATLLQHRALAGLRDPQRLRDLPPAQQREWGLFWSDVKQLRLRLLALP